MKAKPTAASMLVILLGATLVGAGDPDFDPRKMLREGKPDPVVGTGEPWKEKPFREWTKDDVAQITSASPWAKTLGSKTSMLVTSVPGAAPAGQPPLITSVPSVFDKQETSTNLLPGGAIIQWASSLTMRQAMAREGELNGTMTSEQAAQLLTMSFQQYVITVRGGGVASMVAGFKELSEEALRNSAYLELQGSKQKIYPLGIEINLQGDPVAWFYFPRELEGQPVFRPGEKAVEFNWVSEAKDKINVTFDLRKMMRDGKPDL